MGRGWHVSDLAIHGDSPPAHMSKARASMSSPLTPAVTGREGVLLLELPGSSTRPPQPPLNEAKDMALATGCRPSGSFLSHPLCPLQLPGNFWFFTATVFCLLGHFFCGTFRLHEHEPLPRPPWEFPEGRAGRRGPRRMSRCLLMGRARGRRGASHGMALLL